MAAKTLNVVIDPHSNKCEVQKQPRRLTRYRYLEYYTQETAPALYSPTINSY
jgi:hypothetical protein